MQNNRFSHARRIFLGLGAALSLMLTGCYTASITNLTPSTFPENPSQIYTISARVNPRDADYVPGTVVPMLVIDGQSIALKKSPLGQDIWEVDYQVPAGRNELVYYIQTNYQIQRSNGLTSSREDYTPLQRSQILSRYIVSIEANRGPVGALVRISGRGFTPNDIINFDETPVRTVFESAGSIGFYVPGLDANRNYRVSIGSGTSQTPVGTFRIDGPVGSDLSSTGFSAPNAGGLLVSPTAITLRRGEKAPLTFTSPVAATAGGLLIDVTTDVPESVIMPEVIIPQGNNTTTITIEGGRPGKGTLFIKGPGVKELHVPITVN
ncbi:MAG: cell surface protein [Nibricoccus sp.]